MSYDIEREELENQLNKATDFLERMELIDKLDELKSRYTLKDKVYPEYPIECFGCGS